MSDGSNTSGRFLQTAQRPPSFPRGRFPRRAVPRARFPRRRIPRARFPRVAPIRRFPIVAPPFFGFPRERCYFVDRFGRCCNRFGVCCDRFGRCEYIGVDAYPMIGAADFDGWYGVPGSWDMVADFDDMDDEMDDMAVYNDMADYDEV